MTWSKLGHVFVPDGSRWWARSYASFPTAEVRRDGRIRVYFTSLDEHLDGRVGYVDVAGDDPRRILSLPSEPVLDVGALGEFDDCGANAFGIATVDAKRYLYYQGWQRTTKAPFLIFSGIAIGDSDGAPFHKVARVPVLDRTEEEPYLRGAPFVLREADAFRMWYVSGTGWTLREGVPQYRVVIRVATSGDGLRWHGATRTCVEPYGDEYAVGRPCVLRDGDMYRMWYSIRSVSEPYRIGYAESLDGVSWTRLDGEAGIERGKQGWDADMICYPYVVDAGGHRYLFFNGNRHGLTGFGVAEWVD
jgi:hypothetical protein